MSTESRGDDYASGSSQPRWRRARTKAFALPVAAVLGVGTLGAVAASGAGASVPLVDLVVHHSAATSASTSAGSQSGTDSARRRPTTVSGTVGTVGPSSFQLAESGSTKTVTVDVTPRTRYTLTDPAQVSDAVPGSYVAAQGTRGTDGSLAATALSIVPAPPAPPAPPRAGAATDKPSPPPGDRTFGKVETNNGTTLTILTRDGATDTVTTSGTTTVTKTVTATFQSVGTGDPARVVGISSRGGSTITAFAVNLGSAPAVEAPPPYGRGPAGPAGRAAPNGQAGPEANAPGAAGPDGPGSGMPSGRPAVVSGVAGAPGTSSFPLTESGGTQITVEVTPHTRYALTSAAAISDAVQGTYVMALGSRSADGSLAATALSIVPAPPAPPSVAGSGSSQAAPRGDQGGNGPLVFGVVQSDQNGTLSLLLRDGQTQTVTTTASTKVTKTVTATFQSVGTGDSVQVAGIESSDGSTITAFSVNVGVTPAVQAPPPGGPGGRPAGSPDGAPFGGGPSHRSDPAAQGPSQAQGQSPSRGDSHGQGHSQG